MNDRARFSRVESLFQRACEMDRAAREQWLDEQCAGEAGLRQEVQALLDEDAAPHGPLDAPPPLGSSLLADSVREMTGSMELPHRIDGYRIVRRIGAGGMGTVFEAEQQTPRRMVALKIINPGLVNASMLRRFQFETEMLGRLQHPGIAQIHAAGTFDGGAGEQPFFAMELIEGTPLMAHAASHALSIRERLQLLCLLCDAVQHAHQRGVVHRDLKPANVLVTADGQPKILDFGVARAIDSDLQQTTQHTNVGQIVGTAPYMSPEQAAGDVDAVDTRSDVYALGVLGYELLTGQLPFDVRGNMLHEALRAIREDEPTPMSSIRRELAGDIVTIISKAMAKDRGRRYASAIALADDIRRFLRDEPIDARPPSVLYQMRKFARRNRALAAMIAVMFGAVLALMFGAVYAAAREHGLRSQAQAEAEVSAAINEFLRSDLLAAADPGRSSDPEVTILEVLDRAADGVEQRFLDNPEVHAAIRLTLADTYATLGRLDDAERHYQAARDMFSSTAPRTRLARVELNATGARLRNAQGRFTEAEELIRAAIAGAAERFGVESPDVAALEHDLGSILWSQGRFEESVAALERVLVRQRAHDEGRLPALETMNSLALVYADLGLHEQAEAMFKDLLRARRAELGDMNWDTINTMISFGQLLTDMGRDAEAEALMLEAMQRMTERSAPRDHPIMIALINNLALLYLYTDRAEEALPMFAEILESGVRIEGAEHPNTLTTMHNQASAFMTLKRFDDALPLFERTHALRIRVLGANHPDTLFTQGMLGNTLLRLKRFDDATAVLEDTYQRMRDATDLGADHMYTRRTADLIATAYKAWNRPEDASRWEAIAEAEVDAEAEAR